MVKPFGTLLKSLKAYAGATIMGDGKVALILDVPGVAHISGILSESRQNGAVQTTDAAQPGSRKQELLLFRAGSFGRLAVPLSLVARLEEIPSSRVEHAAGGLVVQYRGQILPLIPLAAQLGCVSSHSTLPDSLSVIVFANQDRRFGLIVDGIIDIVEESVTVTKASEHQFLIGSAVVGGKVTDFLDMHTITESLDQDWRPQDERHSRNSTVLLAETSAFSRGLLRGYLEIAGHKVLEASDAGEALGKLADESIDIVMAALDLPDGGALQLLQSIRSQHTHVHMPVVALNPRRNSPEPAGAAAFSDCLYKFDRVELSRSLERLARAADPARWTSESVEVAG